MSDLATREVEWKLAGAARIGTDRVRRAAAAVGLRLRERDLITQVDVYLDTADLELLHSGRALRMRRRGGRCELTLKIELDRRAGFAERDEITAEVDARIPSRVDRLPRPLREALRDFADARLSPLVELRTKRRVLEPVRVPIAVEIALDDVQVRTPEGERIGEFHECEIELRASSDRAAWAEFAAELRQRLGLQDAPVDKLRHALGLMGVHVEATTPRSLHARMPVCEAARCALAAALSTIESEEARVLARGSTRAVHRLRVACRRVRAVLAAFAEVISEPVAHDFGRRIRTPGRACARLRELDVLIDDVRREVDGLPAAFAARIHQLRRHLAATRSDRLADAVARLRRGRGAKRNDRLQRFLAMPSAGDTTPLLDFAPDRLREAGAEAFARMGDVQSLDDDGVHRLRLALKRLRYTAELFEPLYGKDLRRLAERVSHLQELTGRHHDAVTSIPRLLELRRKRHGLPRKDLPTLGALSLIADLRGDAMRLEVESACRELHTDEPELLLDAILRGDHRPTD